MKKFSEFSKENDFLDGDKVKISSILGLEIEVLGYQIIDSKYEGKGKCLKLQFKIDGEKHVIFTGSLVLIQQCKTYEKEMPFLTKISQNNKYYTFV